MYGLDSIRRFQEGGVTDALVRQYLDSRPGISESQIAQVMRETGVSPEQVARVTGADPGYVSQRYNQYLDLVDKSTVRPVSGPPSPAVSPAVSNSISLTPAGIAALAPSANVSSPANVFSPADYGPPSPIFDPTAEIQRMQAQRIEAERLRQIDLERPIVDPKDVYKTGINTTGVVNQQTDAERPIVDPKVETFNSLIREGKFGEAGVLATNSGFTPEQVLPYLNDPNIFPEFGGNVTLDTVKSFVPEDKGIATVLPPPVDTGSGTGLGASEEFTNAVRGGYFVSAAQIAQNLGYNAQQTAEYINANAAALGLPENFAGVTGENLQSFFDGVNEKRINPGMDDPVEDPGTDFVQGVVTDEAGNILSGPPDKVISSIPRFARQTQSNVPFAPLRRGLAQLRPAMYMPGLTSGQAPLGGSGFTPEALRTANQGLSPADRAYLMDVGSVSPAEASAAIGTPVGQLQAEYNQLRPGGLFSTGVPASRGLPEDFALQTGAYGAPTPTFLALPEKKAATSAAETPLPSGSTQGTDYTQNPIIGYTDIGTPIYSSTAPESTAKEGGLIKMAEGGAPPKMTELFVEDMGSTFDISKYIDDDGRLVGGYSKPIYDENRVITGYDYRPYERDVVFGKELREKETAMRLTDAEREQMMVEMAMRQGRTGISPTTGGLAGIQIGEFIKRNRPQYYSTVEQFRPRYAEGGIASVAQNLADKGRKGDSMLVHMTPDEVAGLQALAQQMGGSLTINPQTGLPEANIFKKLLPMALGFALGPAGFGVFQSALSAGLAVGAGYTLATGSLQQGLSAGLSAYGGSNLGTGLQAAGGAAGADAAVGQAAANQAATDSAASVAGNLGGEAASTALVDSVGLHPDLAGTITPSSSMADLSALAPGTEAEFLRVRPEFGQATSEALRSDVMAHPDFSGNISAPLSISPEVATQSQSAARDALAYNPLSDPEVGGIENLGAPFESRAVAPPRTPGSAFTGLERSLSGDKATRDLAAADYAAETDSTLGTSALQIMGGAAGQSAADAERAVKAQQAAIVAKKDERKRRFDALFGRTVGTLPARSGGLMKLAGGGMTYMEAGGTTGPTGTPRDVTGTGDGMSDSVPASIEGVQEARLADGEFVIPADVVADIGNGSSDAGSKKLYDMMDRIRKARHGTTEQPPEIQAERLMPA
jgi:hypothetical protein